MLATTKAVAAILVFNICFPSGAAAQLHTSPPRGQALHAGLDSTSARAGQTKIEALSAVAGSYNRNRAYLGTDILTAQFAGHPRLFVQLSAARVVSSVDTGSDDQRRVIRDRIKTVTTLVNNGGQQSMRIGYTLRDGAQTRISTYGSVGSLGAEDEDENGIAFNRVGAGAGVEALAAFDLTNNGKNAGQFFIGLRGQCSGMLSGAILTSPEKNNILSGQGFIGVRSASGTGGMGLTISLVPGVFREYMPRVYLTAMGFGK